MSVTFRNNERRRFVSDLQAREKEIASVLNVTSPCSPKSHLQMNDKRVRREIANGNERRRMQCINAGFTTLRALIPHLEGEKLSKAAILQQSIDYIASLEKDKTRLQMQLERTTRLLTDLGQQDNRALVDPFLSDTPPPPKRKKRDTESSDEGVGSLSDASDDSSIDLRQKNEALKHQMDRERQRVDSLEEENKSLRNLIGLIQKQSQRDHPPPITLVATETHLRDMVEVMSPQLNYTPPHHQDEVLEYTVPLHPASSLTPDSAVTVFTSATPPHIATNRIVEPVTVISNVKVELRDTPSSVSFLSTPSPSHVALSSPSYDNGNTATSIETTQPPSSDSAVLHNYAHRDHPRRRRHQAQLERQRIEEEERQQKEEEDLRLQLQQQQIQLPVSSGAATYITRPHHSVRSLDILAEAANHVKDDRTSAGLFQEDHHPLHHVVSNQPILIQTTAEDKLSRLEIQLDTGSDRLSPLHPSASTPTSLYTSLSSPRHLLHPSVSPQRVPNMDTTSSIQNANSIIGCSNSFSDKYPIATHLLHRPLHTPFSRPGVIVHKH